MKHFFCKKCNNPLKIKEGDFIFSYNIECYNNHISENVDLEDILSTKKEESFICENHKKNKVIHCINCNEDICFICFKETHHLHKMEYLKSLNYDHITKYSFEVELKEEKKYMESFINELLHFKNQLNLYIDILKSDLQKYHKFRCDIINNISPEVASYINIENVKNVFKSKNFEIKNIFRNFLSCESFIQRYDNLKNIFELMFKKGKYIENEIIKDIYKEKIIPIDDKFFLNINDKKFIILEKALELNLRKYKFNNKFEKLINFEINKIELKENKNIKKKLSLYALSYSNSNSNSRLQYLLSFKTILYEITIENLCDFNIKTIATYDKYINLFVLSENKNIIDDGLKISLYDDNTFKSPKLVTNEIFDIYEFLKIDPNTFIYSSKSIFLVKIIKNTIYKTEINNCGTKLIYFSEKKKIIFTHDSSFIYLVNINYMNPELIQKIEIKFSEKNIFWKNHINNTYIIRYLSSFNDESIYLTCNDFMVQYKIIGSELVEISKIKI